MSFDKDAIEANRLRIWEELAAKQASGAKPPKRREADATAAPDGPFAGLKKAFADSYKEADAMAYAQAVALNKNLEDRGILDKAPRRDQCRNQTFQGRHRVRWTRGGRIDAVGWSRRRRGGRRADAARPVGDNTAE